MLAKNKNNLFVLMVTAILLLCSAPISADMTAQDILKRADEARGANTEGLEWEMDIDSMEKGRLVQRTVQVLLRGYDALVKFTAPADVKGMKFLMVDRKMWFMKPGLSKAVSVSAKQKLAGGASNGDIASTNYVMDYQVTWESEEVLSGESCYLYDLSATEKKATYDRIRYWISKERLVGLKAEYYTVSGKLFKSAFFEYANHLKVGGKERPFISKMTIQNALITEDVTTMTYRNPVLRKIPDSFFNLNPMSNNDR